jgi:hypothetical protein
LNDGKKEINLNKATYSNNEIEYQRDWIKIKDKYGEWKELRNPLID